MKKILALICILLSCHFASAQPTSFGGITPGKTTKEELNSLAKKIEWMVDSLNFVYLKRPEGKRVNVAVHGNLIYKVSTHLGAFDDELKAALIEKYGQPSTKVGGLSIVKCRNKLGASFDRYDGTEEWSWPEKDGVQGAFVRTVRDCSEYVHEEYVLRHLATVKVVEADIAEQVRKHAEEKRRKLGDAY